MTQTGFDDGENPDDVPVWEDQVMATVAGEVRRRRKELRMSAQELADRCEEIGHPIPRNVIANMESGRRASLPLVDVMVLAAALRTYPICLIYPVGYVERVQRQPLEDSRPTWDAMHWFTGEVEDDLDTESGMLRNFRAHANHQRAALAALKGERYERWKAETANNPAAREDALIARDDYARRAAHAKRGLLSARAFIDEDGGTPPDLPLELSDVDPPDDSPSSTEEMDI
ncbi:helix-turn-helix transcriptional regulator [Streptomyces sp. SID13588]|uniref:helix-turn-helix domain-containing protein n=1 Tax=Streptomyces sp. SID13588 TaxID=2706051 RepID=UPI0013C9445A|nr:helix-turn-helix transcriptional regulator [Streptomyces sp. SID13588]NEA73215.1 helix-turn-helix transcriptional regulator [Streptomyces sp. SID13588]